MGIKTKPRTAAQKKKIAEMKRKRAANDYKERFPTGKPKPKAKKKKK